MSRFFNTAKYESEWLGEKIFQAVSATSLGESSRSCVTSLFFLIFQKYSKYIRNKHVRIDYYTNVESNCIKLQRGFFEIYDKEGMEVYSDTLPSRVHSAFAAKEISVIMTDFGIKLSYHVNTVIFDNFTASFIIYVNKEFMGFLEDVESDSDAMLFLQLAINQDLGLMYDQTEFKAAFSFINLLIKTCYTQRHYLDVPKDQLAQCC